MFEILSETNNPKTGYLKNIHNIIKSNCQTVNIKSIKKTNYFFFLYTVILKIVISRFASIIIYYKIRYEYNSLHVVFTVVEFLIYHIIIIPLYSGKRWLNIILFSSFSSALSIMFDIITRNYRYYVFIISLGLI